MALCVVAFALFATGSATPWVSFPLNAQVPPIARVSRPFNFTFSASTVTASEGELNYKIATGPPWLRLDGKSRSFSGTPGARDVGPTRATVTAKDESGSVDIPLTLVVSADPGPRLVKSLESQLRRFGALSDPNSLLMYPSTSFDFAFDSAMFSNPSMPLYYDAVSSDNTPLPSWVGFDNKTLRMSGTSPQWTSLIAPPQTFGIKLLVSDITGFSGATAIFDIVVGSHKLAFKALEYHINVTKGGTVDFTALKTELLLDGQPIDAGELKSAEAVLPPWLQFDTTTLAISGTSPTDAPSISVPVNVADKLGDAASVTVHVNIQSQLFNGPVNDVNVTAGEDFVYKLDRSVLTESDVDATSSASPPVSWISFDNKAFAWKGTVPDDTAEPEIVVSLNVTSRQLLTSESRLFKFKVELLRPQPSKQASSVSESIAKTTSSATATPTQYGALEATTTTRSRRTIVVAIVVPIAVLVAAVLLLLLAFWRRKQTEERRRSPLPRSISRPIVQADVLEGLPIMEKKKSDLGNALPKLPLLGRLSSNWKSITNLERLQKGPATEGMGGSTGSRVIEPRAQRSTAQSATMPARQTTTNFSLRETTVLPSRPSQPGAIQRKRFSPTDRIARKRRSNYTSAMTLNRRLSGIGHGSGVQPSTLYGPPASGFTRVSWRTSGGRPEDTEVSSYMSSATTSTDVLMFPNPPSSPAPTNDDPPSVRLVTNPDPTRISAGRAERYGYRRAGQSPLFAGSSRASSRSRTWKRQTLSSNPPLPAPVPSQRDRLDHFLQELTNDAGDHAAASARASRNVGADQGRQSPFRTLGSRITGRLNRASRQLSNLSTRFQSASSSPQSEDDREDNWRSLNASKSPENRYDSPDSGDGSYADLLDELEVEYGVASHTKGPSLLVEAPPAPFFSGRSTPRLVEFKDKRPVSVETNEQRRATQETSRTASLANAGSSGIWRSDAAEPASFRSRRFL
ncbi:MAG: hypothetical protein M1833_006099 [Piccolia ochrophora]|nr:MAG: hypothetical protein M1833_006099 [Piccolia ochrophora]